MKEIAQFARDRGGLEEAGRDCKELLERFFAFTGHFARGLLVAWEGLPERFAGGADGKVLWFEENSEGSWVWKFERCIPGRQPRIEGRIYLVLGAETRDRERLLLIPGSPPLPYNLWKEEPAPRDSRRFPSESSEAALETATKAPERWLEEAARERERAHEELLESSEFQVGVDLRLTWAAEQKKDQVLIPLIAGCRERDREIVERFQIGTDGVLERLVKIDEWEVARWVPVVPKGWASGEMTWKEFCFRQARVGLMGGHRKRILKRICWWQDMMKDIETMTSECLTCAKGRKRPTKQETVSVKPTNLECWEEVMVDFEGRKQKCTSGIPFCSERCSLQAPDYNTKTWEPLSFPEVSA